MILVTLGTQDKSFERLLKAIDKKIDENKIKDKVVVQAGMTKYESKNMEIYDFVEYDKFDDLIKKCDILITHGGVGSIITGLKNNKKVIAAARLKKYKEHTNDHQLQIIENFRDSGFILELTDFDKVDKKIEETKNFKPNKYKSNKENFIKIIDTKIEKM